MNLSELLESDAFRANDGAIALKTGLPFTWATEAVIVSLDEEFEIPQDYVQLGFEALLDCEEAETILQGTVSKAMSHKTKAELLIHYAAYDAYPAWLNDIPDR